MKAKSALWLLVTLGVMMVAATSAAQAAGAGVGKTCGGFIGIQCNAGLFCQFKTGSCGMFDFTGTCTRAPRFCIRIFRPVCGCDGKTYGNDCDRQAAMVSKRHDGKCT